MTQACMGGWCTKRDHCANYHAATPSQQPAERLCPPGQDGAGLQAHTEQITMIITPQVLKRVQAAVPAEGLPLRTVSANSGVHISNVRSAVKVLAEKGVVFLTRAGTGEGRKHELWAFSDEKLLDRFDDQQSREAEARRVQAANERLGQRRAERAGDSHRSAVSLAAQNREIERSRKREQAAVAKAKEDQERKSVQAKLRRQTKAAGAEVFKAGTVSQRPRKVLHADLPVLNPNGVQPVKIPSQLRDRFAPDGAVQSVISSAQARPWAKAVAA